MNFPTLFFSFKFFSYSTTSYNFFLYLQKSYCYFDRNHIRPVHQFGKNWHIICVESSNPWTRYIFPFMFISVSFISVSSQFLAFKTNTYFVRFVPNKIFVNSIVFLNLCPCVYENTIDFCKYVLYPVTLLNSLINFGRFFIDSLGFSM